MITNGSQALARAPQPKLTPQPIAVALIHLRVTIPANFTLIWRDQSKLVKRWWRQILRRLHREQSVVSTISVRGATTAKECHCRAQMPYPVPLTRSGRSNRRPSAKWKSIGGGGAEAHSCARGTKGAQTPPCGRVNSPRRNHHDLDRRYRLATGRFAGVATVQPRGQAAGREGYRTRSAGLEFCRSGCAPG